MIGILSSYQTTPPTFYIFNFLPSYLFIYCLPFFEKLIFSPSDYKNVYLLLFRKVDPIMFTEYRAKSKLKSKKWIFSFQKKENGKYWAWAGCSYLIKWACFIFHVLEVFFFFFKKKNFFLIYLIKIFVKFMVTKTIEIEIFFV